MKACPTPLLWVLLVGALARPAIADTISPRELLEVIDFNEPVISPDGQRVAVRTEQASIERNTWDSTWYVLDMDGSAPPRRVADGGVPLRDSAGIPLPAALVWSTDGRWVYYRAMLDGAIDVWRASADGSGAERLTHDPADVRTFELSDDGLELKYSVGATREEVIAAERSEYDQGIHIDETTPIGQPLYRSGAIEGRLATQRLGSWSDRVSLLAGVPDHWKVVDLNTGAVRELRPSELPRKGGTGQDLDDGANTPWKWVQEIGGDRIAVLTHSGEGVGLLDKPEVRLSVRQSVDARTAIECRDLECIGQEITGIRWRPDSDEVLYTVSDPGAGQAQSVYRWNVRTGVVQPVVRSSGLLNGGRDPESACGVSAVALACVAAAADQPPRLESISLETGEVRVLFDPNAALAKIMMETMPVRLLRWTDAKGQPFTGQFYPAHATDGAPPPLFVTYYTCTGYVRGGYGDEWPLASLAAQGIAALCINRKPGYTLDAVERYGEGVAAVEGAIDLLASAGEIDRSRVGMGGLSFGTEVTMWTVMHSNVLRAASTTSVMLSPTYYLFRGLKRETFAAGLQRYWQAGAPDQTPERWKALAPSENLEKIRVPVLMQMSEQEYLDALDYAIPLISAHRADLFVFPNEPHQKFQPRHKLAAYQRNLDWFCYWLLGREDPDPSKRQQYTRWRLMRTEVDKSPEIQEEKRRD